MGKMTWSEHKGQPFPLLKMLLLNPAPRVMNHLLFSSLNQTIPWKKDLPPLPRQSIIPPFLQPGFGPHSSAGALQLRAGAPVKNRDFLNAGWSGCPSLIWQHLVLDKILSPSLSPVGSLCCAFSFAFPSSPPSPPPFDPKSISLLLTHPPLHTAVEFFFQKYNSEHSHTPH